MYFLLIRVYHIILSIVNQYIILILDFLVTIKKNYLRLDKDLIFDNENLLCYAHSSGKKKK